MGSVLSSNVIIYIYLTLQEHDETPVEAAQAMWRRRNETSHPDTSAASISCLKIGSMINVSNGSAPFSSVRVHKVLSQL